jgi:hypothetical protein
MGDPGAKASWLLGRVRGEEGGCSFQLVHCHRNSRFP